MAMASSTVQWTKRYADQDSRVDQPLMQLYTLDPTLDSRWDDLVASHPSASAFHHKGWLAALAKTYGYRPMILTSTPPGKRLDDGIVFCEVKSWITGSRLVSLPFVDHLEPLRNELAEPLQVADWMRATCRQRKWKYIEFRPLCWEMSANSPLVASQSFWIHTLNLAPPLEQIFRGFHKNCIQRRIRRAEHERLSYEKGNSEELLDAFYRLLLITRRRHRLLPQPRAWFQNLIANMGPILEIRLARKNEIPVAAILTLRHRGTVVYKYGCSDERFHHLGGMPFLFWMMIEEAKASGADEIDFGRTDLDNEGLIKFKDRFGAKRRYLTYFRYPESKREKYPASSDLPLARCLFSVLPDALSSWAGHLLYRHFG
jgi:CelD/BcsL family acetyltransferase involved in cellulose biosynthesis